MENEWERQFLLTDPASFAHPAQLAGTVHRASVEWELSDTYLDTCDGALRRWGWTVRIRERRGAPALCTVKGPKTRHAHGIAGRAERETPMAGRDLDACRDVLGASPELVAIIGGLERLEVVGTLHNARIAHEYACPYRGALELVVDRLHYPVGPDEHRVEVELKDGPLELLEIAAAECAAHPALTDPRRGKRKELVRRLARAGHPVALAVHRTKREG